MALDPAVADDLRRLDAQLRARAAYPPREALVRAREQHRARFGPQALEALAERSGRELSASLFDEQRATGLWHALRTGGAGGAAFGAVDELGPRFSAQLEETERGAAGEVEAARGLCAELSRSVALIDELEASGDLSSLSARLSAEAPRSGHTAWAHKHLSMLRPEVVSSFHLPVEQRFHLCKLLLTPPPPPGLFAGDLQLSAVAEELELPLDELCHLLRERHGKPHRYVRVQVGTRSAGRLRWLLMREGGFVAVGSNELGDLGPRVSTAEARAQLRDELARAPGAIAARASRMAAQFIAFVSQVEVGDVVVATEGARALGVGVVRGPYAFVNDRVLAHRRPVQWLTTEERPLPQLDPSRGPLHHFDEADAIIEVERLLLASRGDRPAPRALSPRPPPAAVALDPMTARIDAALRRKGQVVLHGPPGTGKTFHARRAALDLSARAFLGAPFDALSAEQRSLLELPPPSGLGAVETCVLHPSYGYEDLVEGYRPARGEGPLGFERRDGVMKRLCLRAEASPQRPFFLLLEEINRGDLPRVLGELLLLLERERRGLRVTLPLSGESLSVPPNVLLIATMNDLDRSTVSLDAALRRRFAFVSLSPDPAVLEGAQIGAISLSRLLLALNDRLAREQPPAARPLRLGHAYFLEAERPLAQPEQLATVLREDVLPLIVDHLDEGHAALARVLGDQLASPGQSPLSSPLLQPGQEEALLEALLAAMPEIEASS